MPSSLPVDLDLYIAFLSVMTVLAISPGPSCFFCIATGMQKGSRAALLGVAGLNAGTLIWFVMAALGLSSLIAAYPRLFHLLGYAGALYILWLSYEAFREAFSKELQPFPRPPKSRRSSFVQGIMVQLTNPKALLFFTAMLPPFIDVAKPAVPQLVAFAIGFMAIDAVVMSVYGLGSARLRARAENTRFRRGFTFTAGALLFMVAAFIGLRN